MKKRGCPAKDNIWRITCYWLPHLLNLSNVLQAISCTRWGSSSCSEVVMMWIWLSSRGYRTCNLSRINPVQLSICNVFLHSIDIWTAHCGERLLHPKRAQDWAVEWLWWVISDVSQITANPTKQIKHLFQKWMTSLFIYFFHALRRAEAHSWLVGTYIVWCNVLWPVSYLCMGQRKCCNLLNPCLNSTGLQAFVNWFWKSEFQWEYTHPTRRTVWVLYFSFLENQFRCSLHTQL